MRLLPAICTALLLCASPSPAAAGAWSPPLTISSVLTEDSDNIFIYTIGGGQLAPGCVSDFWIFNAATEERRARAWATVLTALAAGKPIKLWVTGVCGEGSSHATTAVSLAR